MTPRPRRASHPKVTFHEKEPTPAVRHRFPEVRPLLRGLAVRSEELVAAALLGRLLFRGAGGRVDPLLDPGLGATEAAILDTTIISVDEEVLLVEKRFVLTEEIRVTKRHGDEPVQADVTLRKEVASIERIDRSDPEAGSKPR